MTKVIDQFNQLKSQLRDNNENIQKTLVRFFDLGYKNLYYHIDSLSNSIEVRDNLIDGDSGYYPLNKLNHNNNYYWCVGDWGSVPQVPKKEDAKNVINNVIDYLKGKR